jgi:putative transposase
MRIRELVEAQVRYGYYRIYILLRREGWKANHKRVCRLYPNKGLSLRRKRLRRHASAAQQVEGVEAGTANKCWSMDFVSDALYDGRRLRALTLIDNDTRECLATEVN